MELGPYREPAKIEEDDFPKAPIIKKIQAFGNVKTCPKCTCEDLKYNHCLGWQAPNSIKEWHMFKLKERVQRMHIEAEIYYKDLWNSKQICMINTSGEHLHVYCKNCGYDIGEVRCADFLENLDALILK